MMNCRRYQEMIEDLLADEIAADDLDALREHCDLCTDCAELLNLHESLQRLGKEIPEPGRSDLRDMRTGVMDRVALEQPPVRPAATRRGFRVTWSDHRQAYPMAAVLAMVIMLAGGVFLGRLTAPERALDEDLLLQAISRQANQQSELGDFWDTPLSFANVAVKQRQNGQLALSFDVSRHIDVVAPQTSPLAREVLLHAILEPSSMGSRFGAMDLTPGIPDNRLKEALILTMHADPSLTVRLNALAVLARYPYDVQTQDALLHTLSQDQEVQMRLMALEQLAVQQEGRETIKRVVDEPEFASDVAVMQRASTMIREF